MLERLFKLADHNTTVQTEILAGATTFLTMSYIVFVNPDILSSTGMDRGACFVATCVAAAVGSVLMGLLANYPVGLAPGMGLNAFLAYTVVAGMGYTWPQALGLVFLSGCIFLLLTATGIRRWLIAGIPVSLRCSIAAGIGLFLALIGLQKAHIIVADAHTLVTLGDLHQAPPLLALGGFLLIAILEARRIRGSILIGVLAVTLVGLAMGHLHYQGLVAMPPSLAPTWLKLDIPGALHADHGGLAFALLHVVLVFVLVEMFDATGTLMGVAQRAGLLADPAKRHRLGRALFADSTAILAGSLIGTSSTTAFVESAAGVQAGGRTGLTAITVGMLFLCALWFAPIAALVPAYATAPALIYVAGLMLRELVDIEWNDITESAPAAICASAMPFTYSIANGLALGFISYVLLKLGAGRWRDVHPATAVISALFIARYALG